jgi:hypothetical protein
MTKIFFEQFDRNLPENRLDAEGHFPTPLAAPSDLSPMVAMGSSAQATSLARIADPDSRIRGCVDDQFYHDGPDR